MKCANQAQSWQKRGGFAARISQLTSDAGSTVYITAESITSTQSAANCSSSIAIRCCLLEKAFSYLTRLLGIRQHRPGSYLIRVQTVNTCQKVIQPIEMGITNYHSGRRLAIAHFLVGCTGRGVLERRASTGAFSEERCVHDWFRRRREAVWRLPPPANLPRGGPGRRGWPVDLRVAPGASRGHIVPLEASPRSPAGVAIPTGCLRWLIIGWTPVGTPRPRSRSEGAIRATLTRTPSASSLLRARRAGPRGHSGQTTSLPSGRTGFDSQRSRSRILARENRAGRCRWSAGFLGDLPFPPPFYFGAAPYTPHFTLIGSQDLAVKSRPNLFTHSLYVPIMSCAQTNTTVKVTGGRGVAHSSRDQSMSDPAMPRTSGHPPEEGSSGAGRKPSQLASLLFYFTYPPPHARSCLVSSGSVLVPINGEH
ncbi:hypothetical protein PR048_024652 [Dryococelus australis]|uniref:Uncharacterized protein n=1 Tax=Dryococelus australis TaxID=614101 RepID=A0ABQ9GP83_9NEOP|nr:hypothetical protein PR048_024652 [Dryococelus australis]